MVDDKGERGTSGGTGSGRDKGRDGRPLVDGRLATRRDRWSTQDFTSVIQALAAALQVYGLYLVHQTVDLTRKQAETAHRQLVSGERPWLKPGDVRLTGLRATGDRLYVSVVVTTRNIGHAPATHLSTRLSVVASDSNDALTTAAVDLCQTPSSKGDTLGPPIFPGDGGEVAASFDGSFADVLPAEKREAVREQNASESAFGTGSSRSVDGSDPDSALRSPFSIVGCILYPLSDGQTARTSFGAVMHHVTRPGRYEDDFDLVRGFSVRVDDVRLTEVRPAVAE